MKLAQHDKQKIMSYLPNFELSYEKLIHNKVHTYELCVAIPYGKKYLAWFTTYNNEYVCIFLEIDKVSKKFLISKSYQHVLINHYVQTRYYMEH